MFTPNLNTTIYMKHIDEAILNYVEQKNTDYTVLLTGKWGSGKTYYLEPVQILFNKCFIAEILIISSAVSISNS